MAVTLSILDRFAKVLGYLLTVEQRISIVCTRRQHFGLISDRTLSTLQLISGESASKHVSLQMVDILRTFCEQTLANKLHFSCVFVHLVSAHGANFYCVDV